MNNNIESFFIYGINACKVWKIKLVITGRVCAKWEHLNFYDALLFCSFVVFGYRTLAHLPLTGQWSMQLLNRSKLTAFLIFASGPCTKMVQNLPSRKPLDHGQLHIFFSKSFLVVIQILGTIYYTLLWGRGGNFVNLHSV